MYFLTKSGKVKEKKKKKERYIKRIQYLLTVSFSEYFSVLGLNLIGKFASLRLVFNFSLNLELSLLFRIVYKTQFYLRGFFFISLCMRYVLSIWKVLLL